MLAGILSPTGAAAIGIADCPNPTTMSFEQWATEFARLSQDVEIHLFGAESAWQEWAVAACRSPTGTKYGFPSPFGFTDWLAWAIVVYGLIK